MFCFNSILENSENIEHNHRDLIRQNIVQLLISTVNQPSVNMAQFLLGFEIRQSVSRTNLQDPGWLLNHVTQVTNLF